MRPVHGRERVARLIVGALRKFAPPDRVTRLLEVDGQPGIINYVDQSPQSVVILDTIDDRVQTIYVINETAVKEVGDRSNTARKMLIVPRNERHNDDDHGIVMNDN